MKKLLFTVFIGIGAAIPAQISTLVINNYTNYYLLARFGANGLNGNCYPGIGSNPSPGQGTYTVPPAISPGVTPFNVQYDKYYYSNLASIPIVEWYVQTNPTIPGGNRPYNHASLNPTGVIANNTDWSFIWLQSRDAPVNGNYYDDFNLGSPSNNCNGTTSTYQLGTYSEAEWFTISIAGTNYTYVQIY